MELFWLGFEKRAKEQEEMSNRVKTTIAGGLTPLAAPIFAEKGKRIESFAGSMLGGMAGHMLGSTTKNLPLAMLATRLGSAGGAYLAHGPDSKKKKNK